MSEPWIELDDPVIDQPWDEDGYAAHLESSVSPDQEETDHE